MTYERLYQLKFQEAVPTYKLGKRFPKERKKISHIALLQLPSSLLKRVVKREEYKKLMTLKEWLVKNSSGKKS